jgi:hypothetical protein
LSSNACTHVTNCCRSCEKLIAAGVRPRGKHVVGHRLQERGSPCHRWSVALTARIFRVPAME